MINIASTAGSRAEVWLDVEKDRVMILADHLYAWWRTAEEAEILAGHLQRAAEELRRRRAQE